MRGKYIWAIILVIVGLWLLLENLNLLPGLTWDAFWAIVLIAAGLALILANLGHRSTAAEVVEDNIPLGGATAARVVVNHGAGRLIVRGGEAPGYLAWGRFGGGLKKTAALVSGSLLEAQLELPAGGWLDKSFAWTGAGALDWDVTFSSAVPLDLKLQTGASEQYIDLAPLKCTRFELNTGASSTTVTLPATAGYTEGRIAAGAASIHIVVPAGVAVRAKTSVGLSSVNVDQTRFPPVKDGFESPGFATSPHRVELVLEGGLATYDLR
ncbi:MAG: hypothetical protein GXX83_07580 [Gaiellales bacterium]|nr:hypothetical protein [Gaiellales bacterium]